jgi:hypothetical protein
MNDSNQKIASPGQGRISLLTSPVSVPSTQNPDAETDVQRSARNEKFISLPISVKTRLSSPETSQKIQLIGKKYGFELLRLANITRLIREYYFGEVQFDNFPTEIEKRMGVSLLTAQEIARIIRSEIINWDPWAEYLARLLKLPIREIAQKFPKIANMEITAGYIKLKNSEDLEDPTIKNWVRDYILHLGYDHHSQMQRAEYLFHSENGKNLSSQDREKLGIILKSFDENIPLPIDEENEEIVFDGLASEQRQVKAGSQKPTSIVESQPTFTKQALPFSRPHAPESEPPRQAPRQVFTPIRTAPPKIFVKPNPISPPPRQEIAHPNFATQPNKQVSPGVNNFFSAPESPDLPTIKIHSITERNETKDALQQAPPQQNVQRPVPPQQPAPVPRPRHRMIEPFEKRITLEPRIDGNVVDLSEQ